MTTLNELRISSNKDELDIDMVHAFLSQETPWAKGMPRETLERAIAGSLCVGGYVGGRQCSGRRADHLSCFLSGSSAAFSRQAFRGPPPQS